MASRPSSAPTRSVTINGRTVTDPAQVERIERNREASARYAVQSYQREGTPIPSHLRGTVEAQIARGDYGGQRNTGGTGTLGLPDPMSGGQISRIAGLNVGNQSGGGSQSGGGTRIAGGALFLGGDAAWNDYTRSLQAADASVRPARQAPSPGPNVFPGLGAPGQPSDRPAASVMTETPAALPAVTPVSSGSVDSGNQEDGEEVSRRNAERSRVPTYEAGGYVGKDGVPIRPSTGSLDLPPALARMLNMPMQSYAEGGTVGPGGMPQRPMASPMAMNLAQQGGAPVVGMAPPGGQGRPLNFAAIDQQAQQFMQQNPQQVEMIRSEVQEAMNEGEIDAQGLNTFVQVATAALQNPEMWPQLRQVLIRQGMLDAEDIGEEYDQGFLIILYIIGKTMGGGQMTTPAPQQAAPMSAGQPPEMSMSEGGPLPAKSKNPDGSIPINAHEGEYVIPADVTRKLGTDHFDKLIAKARGAQENGGQ